MKPCASARGAAARQRSTVAAARRTQRTAVSWSIATSDSGQTQVALTVAEFADPGGNHAVSGAGIHEKEYSANARSQRALCANAGSAFRTLASLTQAQTAAVVTTNSASVEPTSAASGPVIDSGAAARGACHSAWPCSNRSRFE